METDVEELVRAYSHIEEIAMSDKGNFKTKVTEWELVHRCSCNVVHKSMVEYCDECGGSDIKPYLRRSHLIKSKKFLWFYFYELNFIEYKEVTLSIPELMKIGRG